jgi:hypothetical protein
MKKPLKGFFIKSTRLYTLLLQWHPYNWLGKSKRRFCIKSWNVLSYISRVNITIPAQNSLPKRINLQISYFVFYYYGNPMTERENYQNAKQYKSVTKLSNNSIVDRSHIKI